MLISIYLHNRGLEYGATQGSKAGHTTQRNNGGPQRIVSTFDLEGKVRECIAAAEKSVC